MKYFCLLLCCFLGFANVLKAQNEAPDTAKVGIYITSIHDINFRDKEYSINMWLWLRYKDTELDFIQNLEVPQAKTFTKSFTTLDSSDGETYILMKLQCIMKDNWRIHNFPFDHQVLRFSIENSQFDSRRLVFAIDTAGSNHHRFTVSGWNIDSVTISTGLKDYDTDFGDEELEKPHTTYGVYRVKVLLTRDAWGLFWKMFLGMYVSFLIALVCLFIPADNMDSRLGLSVGSLFTAIGNKYVIDSSLPDTSTFTLVDTLHSLTLVFILGVIVISVYDLRKRKQGLLEHTKMVDRKSVWFLLGGYLLFNLLFIGLAQ